MSERDEIWIHTDSAGYMQSCSPAALEMLGYSARGVRGRLLLNMFVRDRPGVHELLDAAQGRTVEKAAEFRPNDRKALPVRYRISSADAPDLPAGTLRWTFTVVWPMGMRLPRGTDRRQLITVWRSGPLRCVYVPAGPDKRRLFVCGEDDEVVHEEVVPLGSTEAFARAAELLRTLADGNPQPGASAS